jgi:GNAT superfamily N-acetyltransferase
MSYQIRCVDHTDPRWYGVLLHLQKLALPDDVVYPPINGWWFIAFDEQGNPVGFAGLVMSYQWNDCAYLCRAGVLAAHRGRGLQKRLIRVRIRKAKQLGLNWLVSDTYENPPSANSLIALKFKIFTPSNPWGATGTTYWRRKLTDAL